MSEDNTSIALRSSSKLVFNHKDMDYYLSWIAGREATGGSLREECLETAALIADGDFLSWQKEWTKLAERIESEAASALGNGDVDGARARYLRACTYYRAPMFIMDPQNPQFRILSQKMRSCFSEAARFFTPPIESIQVPYKSKYLHGYIWRPDDGETKRPSVIVIGGIETFAEDCFFMVGTRGNQEGYNIIAVDLPGQGMNPFQGLFLEARSEGPIKAVTDYVMQRDFVDSEKLALFGFSWGGHIVLRGTQFDSRIRALVADPATTNIFSSALAQQGTHRKNDPIGRIVFEQIAWRFGVGLDQTTKRLARGVDFLLHARVNPKKIECPTLCIAGTSEAKITLDQTTKCFGRLPHPMKKLEMLTEEQGGSAHCQVDNLPLLHGIIFDWLREVFHSSI